MKNIISTTLKILLGILLLPFAIGVLLIMAIVIGLVNGIAAIQIEFGDW